MESDPIKIAPAGEHIKRKEKEKRMEEYKRTRGIC